jgi:HK97 family phage portal protein
MKLPSFRIPFISKKRSAAIIPDDKFFAFPWGYISDGEMPITPDTALCFTPVFAAVRVIAGNLAGLPLITYKRQKDGGKDKAVRHPLYKILKTTPNKRKTTSFEFREMLTGHMLLWGNGYAQILRNMEGDPLELIPMHPSRVTPKMKNGEIVYEVKADNGETVILPGDEVLHVRGFRDGGLEGISVIAAARKAIEAGLALESFGTNFFSSGAFPTGVLEYEGAMPDEARENLRTSWEKLHGGKNRGKKVAVLEANVKWKPMGIPQADAQFLEQRRFSVEEIARIYGVPPHLLGDLTRSTFCLPADQEVFTENGPVSIASVKAGDLVWSLDPKGGWKKSRVLRSACSGEDKVLTFHARGRTVRCNARHRLLVRREVHLQYEGGQGKYLTIEGKKYRRGWELEYVPAGEIETGDYLVGAECLPDEDIASCPTREVVTEQFMEVLGMLLGDGFFFKSKKGPGGFGISHAENASYMPYYVRAVEAEFRQYCGPYGQRYAETAPITHSLRDKNTTTFWSGLAYRELEELGMIGTSHTKRVPAWVFKLNRKLKLAFLRGYLDADGTVSPSGRVRFCSVNKSMMSQIRHLAISVGLGVANIFESEVDSAFNGKAYTHILHILQLSGPADAILLGTHTPEYTRRVVRALKKRHWRENPMDPCEQRQSDIGDGLSIHLIQEIEESETPELVYDLEVEETHSFIANGVVVHNSNIETQSQEFLTYCLRPWMERWEQAIVRDLLDGDDERYFVKHVANALLRGDSAARSQFYSQGIQWGYLSKNDVRGLEDMNPIGPEGDIYLSPMNMVPAGEEGKDPQEPAQKPAQNAPKTEEKPEKDEKSRVNDAFRGAFLETWQRVVRKEINAVKAAARKKGDDFDPWFDEFVTDHRAYSAECLREMARAYCSLRGLDVDLVLPVMLDEYRMSIRDRVDAWKAEPASGYNHREDELAIYWAERLLGYSGNDLIEAA